MKKHVPSNKKTGAILVIVMAVLVAFSLLIVALLQLGSFNQSETTRQLRITQAHWLAEAGLERALSRIMRSTNFLIGTVGTLSNNFTSSETLLGGLGSYQVIVFKTNINAGQAGYGITSVGTAGNNAMVATDEVRLFMQAGPGGQQALLALGTNATSTIAANSSVDGSIYVAGILSIANGVHSGDLTGLIQAGKTNGNAGVVIPGELPDPGPPTIDRKPYTNLLYYATNTNHSGVVSGNINSSALVFNGGTNYIKGNLQINGNIPAGETLVVTGAVTVANGITIGARTKITSGGNISFGNHARLEAQTEIFTLTNIIFATQGATATNGTTLMAMGNIDPAKNLDFNGIIYTEGSVNVTSGSKIRGTIITGQGFDLASNVHIYYDPSVFANPNPINYGGAHYFLTNTWQWAESPF